MAEIKLSICDPSDLRIKHMNSKTVTFRRHLRIRGLRSTIWATIRKVKFLVISGASFYIYFFVLRLAHAARHSMWEGVAPKQRLHEAISPRTDPSIIHLIAREAQGLKRMPRSLQNRPEHRGSLQPTTMKWPPQVWTHWSCKSLHGCRNN
jgi:hypothetical protein